MLRALLFGALLSAVSSWAMPPASPQCGLNDAVESEADVQALWRRAEQLTGDAASATQRGVSRDDIGALLEERANVLQRLAFSAPEAAWSLRMTETSGNDLAEHEPYLEQAVWLSGVLDVRFVDDEAHARGCLRIALIDVAGLDTRLAVASLPADAGHGDVIRARGVRLGDAGEGVAALLVDPSVPLEVLPDDGSVEASSASASRSVGAQNVIVLPVNFQDQPSAPWPESEIAELVFGGSASVDAFYRENSYGAAWLQGFVNNWVTLPIMQTCDTNAIAQAADDATQTAGVELSAYDRRIYVFPDNPQCAWSGMGTIGGTPSRAWINGRLTLRTWTHELGHNMGLFHAHRLECAEVSFGPECSQVEYGDRFDVMGSNGVVAHFNAFAKRRLGWMQDGDPAGAVTATTAGTYVIGATEVWSAHPKALRVPAGVDAASGAPRWLYIELRQAVGFDAYIGGNENVTNGVLIHQVVAEDGNSGNLLDMTPQSSPFGYDDWNDPALTEGLVFEDPGSRVRIAVVAVAPDGATVDIEWGDPVCAVSAPAVEVLTGALEPGVLSTIPVQVQNRDDSSCVADTFNLTAAGPVGWSVDVLPSSVSLAPGDTAGVDLNVSVPADAVPGDYQLSIRVAGEVHPASDVQVAVSVETEAANTAPMANDDEGWVVADEAISIDVIANDFDVDGDTLSVLRVDQGTKGRVFVDADGTLRYLPDGPFRGTDTFAYLVSDGRAESTATVTIRRERSSDDGTKGGGKGKGGKK